MAKTATSRRYTGPGPRPDRTKAKRDEAKERNEFWSKYSPAEQLLELDSRLGIGVGAKRQRARIAKQISVAQV